MRLTPLSVAAQTAAAARRGPGYTPPRTAWGDPDLQGVYTNSNEYATPLERPKEFDGRRLEDLTAEDLDPIFALEPEIVVLGCGLSNVEELYTRGVDEVAKRVFSDSLETPIVKHALGDSAGVIGAALIGV